MDRRGRAETGGGRKPYLREYGATHSQRYWASGVSALE